MTLSGVYSGVIGDKWRVVIPAPVREALGAPVILTRGDPESLLLTSPAAWERLERHAPPEARAWAAEVPVDATTGRVLIPACLREALGLRRYDEVVWAGHGAVVVGQRRRAADQAPAAPGWLPKRLDSRRVSVDRGTLLLAMDLLAGVKGRRDEVRAVVGALARCCDG